MAAATRRRNYVQMTYFLVALCWHLLSIDAAQESCTLETNFKDDDFPCRKLLHCRQPSDWSSLSAEIKKNSYDNRLCAIVVDCANSVTISNVDFQAVGGRFDRVLNVTVLRCNTTRVRLADDMYLVVEIGLNGNAFDSLDFMQDWQNTEFEAMHLCNNRIKNVRQNDFSKFNHLSSHRLDANLITDVEAGSFLNNHELVSVDLANNRLEIVAENMFRAMGKLKVVQLARNRINSMASGAFANIHLESLDLSHKDITTVPNSAFVDSSVLSLNISNCQLSSIPSAFLSSLQRNLTTLDLSYNNIEHVASDAFAHLSQLRVVYHAGVNIGPSLLPAATTTTTTTSSATTTTTTTSSATTTTTTTPSETTTTKIAPQITTMVTTSAETTQTTTTSLSPSKTSTKFTTRRSPTTSQAAAPRTPSTGSKTPSTRTSSTGSKNPSIGSNTLIWVIVAFAVLTAIVVVVVVILRRMQSCRKTDVQPTPSSNDNQNTPADYEGSTYDTIPAAQQLPEYTALDADRANGEGHVYDRVKATSTSQYATLNPGYESAEQTYTRLGRGPASSAANGLTARQQGTTESNTNTTGSHYMSLTESREGPYDVPYEVPSAART